MMALYMAELLTFSYRFPLNTTRIFTLQQYNGESLGNYMYCLYG